MYIRFRRFTLNLSVRVFDYLRSLVRVSNWHVHKSPRLSHPHPRLCLPQYDELKTYVNGIFMFFIDRWRKVRLPDDGRPSGSGYTDAAERTNAVDGAITISSIFVKRTKKGE